MTYSSSFYTRVCIFFRRRRRRRRRLEMALESPHKRTAFRRRVDFFLGDDDLERNFIGSPIRPNQFLRRYQQGQEARFFLSYGAAQHVRLDSVPLPRIY